MTKEKPTLIFVDKIKRRKITKKKKIVHLFVYLPEKNDEKKEDYQHQFSMDGCRTNARWKLDKERYSNHMIQIYFYDQKIKQLSLDKARKEFKNLTFPNS